ncbi:NADP-dependent malic enzyme [Euphorbia peplus]|nr:NADP-dependent malic enzyme [Euphorbia peplus]
MRLGLGRMHAREERKTAGIYCCHKISNFYFSSPLCHILAIGENSLVCLYEQELDPCAAGPVLMHLILPINYGMGLIVKSRKESLHHFKKPWAHEHEPKNTLLDAVNDLKSTVLIGTFGVGRTFTKEVVEAMASFNEGHCIFASGSPFTPVEPTNAYVFPGFGLGLIMSGTIRVHDVMLLAASEALAAEVTQENYDKGLIYPPFMSMRKISANIAAKVAAKAYELGWATPLPQPKDLLKHAESCLYSPSYRSYRYKERDAHYLRGLLPPTVIFQDLQVKKMMHIIRQYQLPLQNYMAMMDLQCLIIPF